MRNIRILLAMMAGAATAVTQPTVRGPMSGFVYDGTVRGLRPVHGVPGAAFLGTRVGPEMGFAQVSPDGRMALGVAEGVLLRITSLETFNPVEIPLAGAIAAVDRIAWSPDSSAAVVYSKESHRLQRLSGLDGAPTAHEPLELAPWGELLTTLAADDRAERIALGIEGAGLFLIAADRTPLTIASLDRADSAVFAGGVLYAADRSARKIVEVRNLSGSPEALLFADENSGVEDPSGLGVAGALLVVATPSARALDLFDIGERRSVERILVDTVPTGIETLGRILLFARPERAGEPFWVLDTILDASQHPRAYFVPAGL